MNEKKISLEQAKIMAQKDLHCDDKRVLLSIRETDEIWIFEAGIPEEVSYGGRNMISINKSSGEIKLFVLPNKENFDILHKSNIIYDYKKDATNTEKTDTYYKVTIPPKEAFENLTVEDIKKGYKSLIEAHFIFPSKEKQIEYLFNSFTPEVNYLDFEYQKRMLELVFKEKTGEELKHEVKIYDISLNDIINYAVKDPYFVKAISDFLDKLDNISDKDKESFLISLYQDKKSFNEFTKEISGSQNANELFNKYKFAGLEYVWNKKLEGPGGCRVE